MEANQSTGANTPINRSSHPPRNKQARRRKHRLTLLGSLYFYQILDRSSYNSERWLEEGGARDAGECWWGEEVV
eukprot:scaffold10270_cov193-Alexandrium_tamarense.AAC.15